MLYFSKNNKVASLKDAFRTLPAPSSGGNLVCETSHIEKQQQDQTKTFLGNVGVNQLILLNFFKGKAMDSSVKVKLLILPGCGGGFRVAPFGARVDSNSKRCDWPTVVR
jgi:hypothetical protein